MTPLPFTELTIGRFRGLRDVSLKDLGQINILVGPNNSGKTSVLEVLSLAASPLDPLLWVRVAVRRDPFGLALRGFTHLRWLFPQDSTTDPVSSYDGRIAVSARGGLPFHEVHATYRDVRSLPEASTGASVPGDGIPPTTVLGVERKGARIDVEVTERLPGETTQRESFTWWEGERFELPRMAPVVSVPIQVITPYDHLFRGTPAQWYSEARRQGNVDAIVTLLSQIDPRITGLEMLAAPGSSEQRADAVIHLRDRSAGLLPLEAFGDGIRRTLLIASVITSVRNGILLIDELEAAIHISALDNAFRWIVNACEVNNVQLFATTHSLEAIDSLLAADQTPARENIVGYRLEATGQTIAVRRYGEDLLRRLRIERGIEVR